MACFPHVLHVRRGCCLWGHGLRAMPSHVQRCYPARRRACRHSRSVLLSSRVLLAARATTAARGGGPSRRPPLPLQERRRAQPLLPSQRPSKRVVALRRGSEALLALPAPNPANENSAVLVYYQVVPRPSSSRSPTLVWPANGTAHAISTQRSCVHKRQSRRLRPLAPGRSGRTTCVGTRWPACWCTA